MSLATQDDLESYLSSGVRVVSVDDGGAPLHELSQVLDGSVLTIRHPTADDDMADWATLVTDLAPHVLLITQDGRPLERTNFAQLSTRQTLLRSAAGVLSYRWVMIGERITLVVTSSETDLLRVLSPTDLHRLGTLLRSLLTTR